MTYVFLNPEGLQNIITSLSNYSARAQTCRESVRSANDRNDSPTDLASSLEIIAGSVNALEDKAKELQARLESAKAANESGITPMGADGTISYVIPDGLKDTAENARANNNVEIASQARTDAEELKSYSSGEKKCSEQQWNSLIERMKANKDNPAYSNVVLANIDPKVLRNIPIAPPPPFQTEKTTHPFREGLSQEQRDEASDVIANILATGSNTWSEEKAEKYAAQLTENIDSRGVLGVNKIFSSSRSVDIDGDEKNESIGLDYNDTMLTSVAFKLEDWDQNSSPDKGDYRVLPWERISGVTHAMTGNTDATTKWLAVNNPDDGNEVSAGQVDAEKTAARTRMLAEMGSIGKNQWTDDWALLSAQEAIVGTNGAHSHGEAQAAIVSGALNRIGEGGLAIQLSDSAKNATSIAISAYPRGIQRSAEEDNPSIGVSNDANQYGWSKNLPYQPYLTNQALANLIGQISQDEAATTRVNGSQEALIKMQLNPEFAPQGNSQYISNALMAQSKTQGFIQGAIARQAEIDGADVDKRVAAWANAASTAIGSVPLPGAGAAAGAFTKAAVDFLKDAGKSAAADGAENGIDATFGGKEQEAKYKNLEIEAKQLNLSRQLAGRQILKSKLYSQEDLSVAATTPGDGTSLIVKPDGELRIQADQPLGGKESEALIQVIKNLPAEKYGAMGNIDSNIQNSFQGSYNTAHKQEKP
jgi:hypothetical protein